MVRSRATGRELSALDADARRLPRALVLLALLSGLALPACKQHHDEGRGTDLLLVTIDTLRADFVSAYGAGFESTPTFDALAVQGVLLERHHTVISLTAPAHLTLFSGLLPSEHGLRRNGQRIAGDVPYLPEILELAGYRTGACLGATVMRRWSGFARGFGFFDEVVSDPERKPGFVNERTAQEVVDAALEFLDGVDERPQFLWVHLYDPHDPYRAPPEHLRPAESSGPLGVDQVQPSELISRDRQLENRRGYAAEVRYADAQLARLLTAWDSRARGRRGLVVVTSDHGEGLGEHDYEGHGFHLYQEQLEVPCTLRFEGRLPAGRRVAAATSAVDLPRTCLELLGLRAPRIGGRSLVPLLSGSSQECRPALLAERREWSEKDVGRQGEVRRLLELRAGRPGGSRAEQIALLHGRWKFIWTADTEHELYDLAADPAELDNAIARRPELAARMRAEIEAWRTAAHARPAEAALDEETQRMLEALGY
jgi:arylsulfatase A-like enzyme